MVTEPAALPSRAGKVLCCSGIGVSQDKNHLLSVSVPLSHIPPQDRLSVTTWVQLLNVGKLATYRVQDQHQTRQERLLGTKLSELEGLGTPIHVAA